MKNQVTIRVPATTANLGPGFDAFGCALSLYTDVTFEETDAGWRSPVATKPSPGRTIWPTPPTAPCWPPSARRSGA